MILRLVLVVCLPFLWLTNGVAAQAEATTPVHAACPSFVGADGLSRGRLVTDCIAEHQPELARIYSAQATRHGDFRGSVRFHVKVAADGRVVDVTVDEDGAIPPDFTKGLVDYVREKVRFQPAPQAWEGDSAIVGYYGSDTNRDGDPFSSWSCKDLDGETTALDYARIHLCFEEYQPAIGVLYEEYEAGHPSKESGRVLKFDLRIAASGDVLSLSPTEGTIIDEEFAKQLLGEMKKGMHFPQSAGEWHGPYQLRFHSGADHDAVDEHGGEGGQRYVPSMLVTDIRPSDFNAVPIDCSGYESNLLDLIRKTSAPEFRSTRENLTYELAYKYVECHRIDDALETMLAFLDYFKDSQREQEISFRVAEIYYGKKDYASALPYYQALSKSTYQAAAFSTYRLAWTYLLLGRLPEAEQALLQVDALPDSTFSVGFSGRRLKEGGADLGMHIVAQACGQSRASADQVVKSFAGYGLKDRIAEDLATSRPQCVSVLTPEQCRCVYDAWQARFGVLPDSQEAPAKAKPPVGSP